MKYKLGEICKIVSGTTPKTSIAEYWDGDIKWLTPAEIKDDSYTIDDTFRKITLLGKEKSGLNLFPKGTVILSSRAPIGKVAIAGCDMCCNQGFKNLICSEKVYNKYLYWFLKTKKDYLNSLGRGATFKEISKQIVSEIIIDLPSYNEQGKIVDKLERLQKIVAIRKKQLLQLDKLTKALFVEMFGDFVENPKCYKKEPIETHVDLLSGYPFKSSQYVDVGINICGGLIIMPQTIKWEDCLHWESTDGYEEYMLQENDIVMALDRPWISDGFKIAKVDAEHLPALLIQRTARIRAIDINQEYLYYCFIIGGFERHSSITGSLVPHISLKDIRSFQILIPPLKLQEQFADIVGKIDKHKSVVQKSLDETQILFDSLMQKYFG